jgi:hypothetical protein
MTGGYSYVMRLLRRLESRLMESGQHLEGGRLGLIIQRFSKTDNLRGALRDLYAVEGYSSFALRLMYYSDTITETLGGEPEEALLDFHVQELYEVLQSAAAPTPAGPASGSGEGTDLKKGLEKFGASLQAVKRGAYKDDVFAGINRSSLTALLQHVNDLGEIARRERAADIARFSSACSTFLRYVLDHEMLKDVRAVNIIDNAGLTLQTTLHTVGEENFDSLQQMVQLLEDPATLLE